jgi:hypothetical protein
MAAFLLLGLLLLLVPSLASGCPMECECILSGRTNYVTCNTSTMEVTVSAVPANTTHLLIYFQDPVIEDVKPQDAWPDFSHLTNLEALALEKDDDFSYTTVQVTRMSFPFPSKLRTFISHLNLKFSRGTFADLTHLTRLSLSYTGVTWSIFPDLMTHAATEDSRSHGIHSRIRYQRHPNQIHA